jgi:hypothetical protein
VLSVTLKFVSPFFRSFSLLSSYFMETNGRFFFSFPLPSLFPLPPLQYLPKERFLYSTEQLMDRMCMTLGGRVSEEIFFSRITTGASDDLQKVTKMAFQICSTYGMNETIGPVSYQQDEGGFQKPFSEKTGQMLDDEVGLFLLSLFLTPLALLSKPNADASLLLFLLVTGPKARPDGPRANPSPPYREASRGRACCSASTRARSPHSVRSFLLLYTSL